jgi:HEAT repeat protein
MRFDMDPDRRVLAVKALADLGTGEAFAALVEVLRDESDPRTALVATAALPRFGRDRAAPALLDRVQIPGSTCVRILAVETLSELRATEGLLAVALDATGDEEVRRACVTALRSGNDVDALRLLSGADDAVLFPALGALGEVGDCDGLERAYLSMTRLSVRAEALSALEGIGTDSSRLVLARIAMTEAHPGLKARAAEATRP